MSSPPVLDLETLLAPIAEDQPTGTDIREDASPTSPYYALKDARNAARAAERQVVDAGEDESSSLAREWRDILTLAPEVLTTRTKDLEVCAWLIEALVRGQGFAGLRDGCALVTGLVDRYWDDLHPMPDEDGLEMRLAALAGLNGEGADGTLVMPLRKVPLVAGNGEILAHWHFEQASELAKVADEERRQRRIEDGAVTMDRIEAAAADTPADLIVTTMADLNEAQDAYAAMIAALDDKAGAEAPPGGTIRSVLETVKDTLSYLGRDAMAASGEGTPASDAVATPAEDGAVTEATAGTITVSRPAVQSGAIASRDDAFRELLKIAKFFRETEPHSPLSYTLEELVRRGRMPLPELLEELIKDEEARKLFYVTAGLKPPEQASDSSSGW
ncbi:type VI secretion system protein TssA [Roseospira visakhapatnamensis]|nr:type VI secretion system protein TssA [Roseospira visakhapatnamensis]